MTKNTNALREQGTCDTTKISSESLPQEDIKAQAAEFTLINSREPSTLSKVYQLELDSNGKIIDGKLVKKTSASMSKGTAARYRANGLKDFSDLIKTLRGNQALSFGIIGNGQDVSLVTKEKWQKLGKPANPQPRSKEAFRWNDGGSVMLLDYDPQEGEKPLSRDELVQAIRAAVPALASASMLWWPSSSSHIFDSRSETDLTGLRGQRLYILVQNAKDIPRTGEALVNHLWAAGYGYIVVSSSGKRLERCLVDDSVWQTNRLDFAAGAVCVEPIEQLRGEPVLITGSVEFIDTKTAIPDPTPSELSKANSARSKAKLAKKEESDQVREQWIQERAETIASRNNDPADEEVLRNAAETARRAVEFGVLSGDYVVTVIEGSQPCDVTVGEILDDPARFHHAMTLDPIEPEYLGHKVIGKLFLYSARPNLYSFAHGGTTYKLSRQPHDIELVAGKTSEAVNNTLEILRKSPEVYDFGDSLSIVDQGILHPLDINSLAYYLGGQTQFWKWRVNRDGSKTRSDVDAPEKVCKQILSLNKRRGLKPLDAVITAPTLRPDGSLLTQPGYDQETRFLVEIDAAAHIPAEPTPDEIKKALKQLIKPFLEFPLVSSKDWGILLSALLTATIRPTLPTAPAIAFDAPVQGSGKTLLAKSISVLSTGMEPSVWPHTHSRDDEETRKRIFTALRSGSRCLVWDNVTGVFDSASLAAALTSPNYTDRILGVSESTTVPNKALFILTGNNLTLAGDMPRRVLNCRIDPVCERPHARKYDVDPLSYVKTHRLEMVSAALTLIRGWLSSSDRKMGNRAPGRMASFEEWDDLVRQTVAWLDREIDPGKYADPMEAVNDAQSNDPEREALHEFLEAMLDRFSDWVTAAEIMKACDPWNKEDGERLRNAITDLIGKFPDSSKSLGRILKFRQGRLVNGLRLLSIRDTASNTMKWKIEQVKC